MGLDSGRKIFQVVRTLLANSTKQGVLVAHVLVRVEGVSYGSLCCMGPIGLPNIPDEHMNMANRLGAVN